MGREKNQWLSNLAENVKFHREVLKISQQSLAEKSKLSMATISKIEISAVNNPTLDTIEALGQAFKKKDPLDLLKKTNK